MHLTDSVLIVDDESHVRLYISLIVHGLGAATVHQAPGGEAAVALYRSLFPKPGLVMLDINMPGIDGLETLRRLRAEGATCPIVMLTSLATRQIVEDVIDAGGTGFIRKDTPKAEIASLLVEMLNADRESPSAMAPTEAPKLKKAERPAVAARHEAAWDRDWVRGCL